MPQKLYDQKRGIRDRAMRQLKISSQAESQASETYPYESDFLQTEKLMPDRQYLAENLFQTGGLRDETGIEIMDVLVRLLQTTNSHT